jgi:hypothetical protein
MRVLIASVFLSALVLGGCSSGDSPAAPPSLEEAATGADYAQALQRLMSTSELSLRPSAVTAQLVREVERMVTAPAAAVRGGPQLLPPIDPNATPSDVVGILWNVTGVLYQNGFFGDGTGDLRADRALAILQPVHYAWQSLGSGDTDAAIAGFEATVEWYEQRTAEGLVPAEVAQFLYTYANIGINALGGSNTSRTLCLDSSERSCVTATLQSIRWEVAILQTRLSHDFSYSFLDGNPPRIDVIYRRATGALNCDLFAPFGTTGNTLLPVTIRHEPAVIQNPNTGGSTLFGCVPVGLIRGFQWDGILVRNQNGNITAICSKSLANPCWEPAAATND